MASSVIGLDIGTTALRAVELSPGKKAKPILLHAYEVPLPHGAVVKGEVINSKVVEAGLKKLWSAGGFKGKDVVLGIGNQGIFARDLSVPKMSLNRIRESLPFQVQDMLQAPLADSLLDFYPVSETLGERGPMINGLLIAAEKRSILENIRTVEAAGLIPTEVDLIPFALNRLLITRPQLEGTVALVDVGAGTTSILISCDGVPNFVRFIPAGGDDLTVALTIGLDIETPKAEELKRSLVYRPELVSDVSSDLEPLKCSCPRCVSEVIEIEPPAIDNSHALEVLEAVAGDLLNGIRNTIKYFANVRPQDPVVQILITGGGSRLTGFSESLAEMTRIPVFTADPFSSLTLPRRRKTKMFQCDKDAIAVAIGLALGEQAS